MSKGHLAHIYILCLILIACGNLRIVRPVSVPTPTATLWSTPTPVPMVVTNVTTPLPRPTATPLTACTIPDLAAWQHLSGYGSYTVDQWAVSGLMTCRIERDTCAYHQLVGLMDPTIVFKKEESFPYHTEDVLMHPAMVVPLSRLSQLVQAEWGGEVALRVTDAYDSLLEHDLNQPDPERKYSLHFEGRAIDLTTWPVDRSRYGRLCALAICAGFDWVHNEITHCHASINAESLCTRCGQ